MKRISQNQLNHAMSYEQYKSLMHRIREKGVNNEWGYGDILLQYNTMNISRMSGWEKRLKLDFPPVHLTGRCQLVVLTEGWCGDAAHIIPVLNVVVGFFQNLTLSFLNRDQNLDLMDSFLTRGGRAIPKAILVDETGQVLGSWGPRPEVLQRYFLEEKAKGELSGEEIQIALQKWYQKDKGHTTAHEVYEWLRDRMQV